jgi:hypothetical protein
MNKETPFYQALKDVLINNVLNIPKEVIDRFYETWYLNFNESETYNFVHSDKDIHVQQNVPNRSVLKGIDLPTWFGDFNNRRIVVLGIDPLRSEKAFKREGANLNNDVIIGTPYAFHEKSTREKDCKSYWTLVEGLKNKNNFVYCTDIFKTYFYNQDKNVRSYNDNSFTGNSSDSVHAQILKMELELIKPDVIIVFGKLAHSFLLNKNCPKIGQSIIKTKSLYTIDDKAAEVFTVLHLSKTPRGGSFKTFFESNGIDTELVAVEDRVQCAEKYIEVLEKINVI